MPGAGDNPTGASVGGAAVARPPPPVARGSPPGSPPSTSQGAPGVKNTEGATKGNPGGVEAPETGGFSHLTGPAGGVFGSSGLVRGRVLRTPGSQGVAWPQNGGRKRSEASRENIDKGSKKLAGDSTCRFSLLFFSSKYYLEETGIEHLKFLSIS